MLAAAFDAAAKDATVEVPGALNPDNRSIFNVVSATGVQIYSCTRNPAGAIGWVFKGPEAQLFDAQDKPVGKHYAGPRWESFDGSTIAGTLRERIDAPQADAIPWVLLTAKSVGPEGSFSKVTSIQRVNTVGGIAPKNGCSQATVGTPARINYTADYYFFIAK